MKRSLYLLVASISGLAFNAHADFYVGPKIGASFNVGEYSSYDTNNTNNIHSSKGGAGASFIGGVAFGYDYTIDSNMYIALDWSLLANNLKNEVRKSSTATGQSNPVVSLKNQLNYGIALQLGYKLSNDVIPFVSLGGSGGKYKLTVNNDGPASRGLNAANNVSIKKTVFGVTPGAGVKFTINDCWVGVAQYEYVMGQKLSNTFTNTTPTTWTYSNKIRQHNVTFSLLYKF